MEKQREGILEKHWMVEMEKKRERECIVEDEEMNKEKGQKIMGKVTEGMMEVEDQGVVEEERKRVVQEVGGKVNVGSAKEEKFTVIDSVLSTVQSSTPEHHEIQVPQVPHEENMDIIQEKELEERVKKLKEAGVRRGRKRILKGIQKATDTGGGEGIREQEKKETVRSRSPEGRIYEICATIYEVVENEEGIEEDGAKHCRELIKVAGVRSMLLMISREQEKELERDQKKEQEKEQIQKEQEHKEVHEQKQDQENDHEQKQDQENDHDQEQAQDQENQKHAHSIIESIESLLIIDDDKAFNQNDADLMEMPEGLTSAKDIEQCQDSPHYLKEIALDREQGKQQKKQGGRNNEDAGVRPCEMGEGGSGAGIEETELTLAPSWKGESSWTKCKLFPSLLNTEIWRKDGQR